MSGKYAVPFLLSSKVENLLRKLITVNPPNRENLEDFMLDPWLNMGQEETLRPYREPTSDDMDPWVTEEVVNPGF